MCTSGYCSRGEYKPLLKENTLSLSHILGASRAESLLLIRDGQYRFLMQIDISPMGYISEYRETCVVDLMPETKHMSIGKLYVVFHKH
jgi:hypothetical protein